MINDKKRRAEIAKEWYHKHKKKVSLRRKELRPLRRLKCPENQLFHSAKSRAKRYGLEFNITKDDIVVPDVCPLLGIRLKINYGTVGPDSPTVDRIIPTKGYVRGNVMVISSRANSIKQNASVSEIELLVSNLKRYAPVV